VAEGTLRYLVREMRHEGGGFFSSQDADSEGVEGKFYAWSWDELVELAGEPAARWYGARPEGNWDGANVLWIPHPVLDEGEPAGRAIESARERLLEARARRIRPATDDKILASWNGLAIVAFAEAGRALAAAAGRRSRSEARVYLREAVRAADFVLTNMRRADGRLLRSWREGRTSGPAFLDDYAMMATACLSLYESTFDLRWMREARSLSADMIRLFRDSDGGGFFQAGSDADQLVVRPKELFDNAVPSGNSMAAEILQRLAHLTGDVEDERAGVSALRVAAQLMTRTPSALGHALGALDLYLGPAWEVAIIGDLGAAGTEALVGEVWARYLPNVVLAVSPPDDEEAVRSIPLLADRAAQDGQPTAYLCQRFACRLPVTVPAELAAQLTG